MLRSAEGVVVDAAAQTDPGRDPSKQTNEDSLTIAETPFGVVAIVCDGMGGHEAGELASRAAVQRILETLSGPRQPLERMLASAIEHAHAEVYALGGDAPIDVRPGSTAVLLALAGPEALIAYVGDSRAYRVRGNVTERLTRDHSVVEALLAARAITPEAAKQHPDANRITRALGIAAEIEPELLPPLHVELGDVFLLCSDGLSDLVEDHELAEQLGVAASPEAACSALVELANSRGGHDNISVAVLRVLGVGPERRENTLEMPIDPHTVVDGGAAPTVLMASSEAAPRTPNAAHLPPRSTVPTLVDPIAGHAAPTGVAPTALATPAAPPAGVVHASDRRNTLRTPAPLLPPRKREARLFFAALFLCVLILVAVALWSALR